MFSITTIFSTFFNPLFDDSTSSDDESSHEEVIHEISFKTYLNPLFDLDEEIISSEFNMIHNEDLDSTPKNDCFDTESYLLESLLNQHEEYISLLERLLYDNSSPRLPEDFHANPNTIIESLPTFTIPVEDSDSLREEIVLYFPGPDDSYKTGYCAVDVMNRIAPDFEPSRAHGFVLRSLELQSSASFGNPISKSYQYKFIL
ncbi:hypothetical protein Tco_1032817 [Tanacetum coccineum]|uniref:Uncharacterized protein n=1 Tax=Tanacetum coccineum TaxID=301880 RepID=A0ABQ5GD11_9ASTR